MRYSERLKKFGDAWDGIQRWEDKLPTEKQVEFLMKCGVRVAKMPDTRGECSRLISMLVKIIKEQQQEQTYTYNYDPFERDPYWWKD